MKDFYKLNGYLDDFEAEILNQEVGEIKIDVDMKKRVQEMRQIAKNTERVRFLEKIEERKEKAKSVSLRLNPVFLKKLKYLSDKYNLSQSAIVEIAIEEMENKLETII